MAQAVPEQIDFSKEEEKILLLWKELDAFHTSLSQSKNRPRCDALFLCFSAQLNLCLLLRLADSLNHLLSMVKIVFSLIFAKWLNIEVVSVCFILP